MNFVGEKVRPKSLVTRLIQTAAVVGIIQGTLFQLMSLIALYCYHREPLNKTDAFLGPYIYTIYLNSDSDDAKPDDIIIGPKEFSYFMYLYLVLNTAWIIVSSMSFWATIKDLKASLYDNAIRAWTLIATVSSLLDLILLFLLSHDYHKVTEEMSIELGLNFGLVLSAIGIVMTLAARGFVLWIINVIFIVIHFRHLYVRHQKFKTKQPRGNRSIIDAYSGSPWQNGSAPNSDLGYENRAFRGDRDTFPPRHYENDDGRGSRKYNNQKPDSELQYGNSSAFTPRTPQSRAAPPLARDEFNNSGSTGLYRYNEPSNPYQQPRTAKIGRQGGQRSPPLNVTPPNLPHIPDPDYSPPGSPKVRGVLRPNSNYMY